MRTYGRLTRADGTKCWEVVQTNPVTGDNTAVWLTTLCQCLLLILGESPRFANYGLPALAAVKQQLWPDSYVTQTQQQFSQYFASLIITKLAGLIPMYRASIITFTGVKINKKVPE